MRYVLLLAALALGAALALHLRRARYRRRQAYIRRYVFPPGLYEKVMRRHPQLRLADMEVVILGLRQFFMAHLRSGRQFVSMPSQIADEVWHEFILYTRHYQQFCDSAFGGFMHHTPAVALGGSQQGDAGLRRCWRHVCQEENIDPATPSRLPLLFALDARFAIANGFTYVPDCGGVRREGRQASDGTVYCGGDLSSPGSGCGGSADGGSHAGDGGGHGAGGGGDGGGDGGGGCGGGGGD